MDEMSKLLALFVRNRTLAQLAELLELQAGLNGLFILAGMIVGLPTLRALQLDQVILGHTM